MTAVADMLSSDVAVLHILLLDCCSVAVLLCSVILLSLFSYSFSYSSSKVIVVTVR